MESIELSSCRYLIGTLFLTCESQKTGTSHRPQNVSPKIYHEYKLTFDLILLYLH